MKKLILTVLGYLAVAATWGLIRWPLAFFVIGVYDITQPSPFVLGTARHEALIGYVDAVLFAPLRGAWWLAHTEPVQWYFGAFILIQFVLLACVLTYRTFRGIYRVLVHLAGG